MWQCWFVTQKPVLFLEDSAFLNFCPELATASLPPISVCFPNFANWNSQGNVHTKIRNTIKHKASKSKADKRNYILIPNGNSLVQDITDSKYHFAQHRLAQWGSRRLVLGRETGEKAVQRLDLVPYLQQSCDPFLRRTILVPSYFLSIKMTKFCDSKVPFIVLVYLPSLTPAVVIFCCKITSKKSSVLYGLFEILSVLGWARKKWGYTWMRRNSNLWKWIRHD